MEDTAKVLLMNISTIIGASKHPIPKLPFEMAAHKNIFYLGGTAIRHMLIVRF